MRKLLSIILFTVLSVSVLAQSDSLPRIVEGPFDWELYKKEQKAPRFNQKDLVMYTVRMEGLAPLFNAERDKDWIDEFHFIDLNGDEFLDAVFSGELISQKGAYTILMIGDSVLSMPRVFEARGYFQEFQPDSTGISFVMRRDGRELQDEEGSKDYLTTTSFHRFDYKTGLVEDFWQLEFPYLTEVPPQYDRESVVLTSNSPFRWEARIPSAKVPVDLDGDGEMDAEASSCGILEKGARLICTYVAENEKKELWTFCIALDPPQKGHVFSVRHKPGKAYAGWIKGDLLR